MSLECRKKPNSKSVGRMVALPLSRIRQPSSWYRPKLSSRIHKVYPCSRDLLLSSHRVWQKCCCLPRYCCTLRKSCFLSATASKYRTEEFPRSSSTPKGSSSCGGNNIREDGILVDDPGIGPPWATQVHLSGQGKSGFCSDLSYLVKNCPHFDAKKGYIPCWNQSHTNANQSRLISTSQ